MAEACREYLDRSLAAGHFPGSFSSPLAIDRLHLDSSPPGLDFRLIRDNLRASVVFPRTFKASLPPVLDRTVG